MTTIGIIGGGKGGTTILGAFHEIEDFKVVGLCDVNAEAPGMKFARKLGVPAFQDLSKLLSTPGLDVIIEATGSEKVREQAQKLKPASALLMDSNMANIMMTFVEGHERILKKARSKKEAFRTSAPFLTPTYGKDGVIYFTTDTQRYDCIQNHNMEIAGIRVGEPLIQGGLIQRCIQTRKAISETVNEKIYGIRLNLWVAPIFEDDDDRNAVVGTYGVFAPRLHPVVKAFDIFAPIIIDSQPEGAWVGASDMEKVNCRMGSEKFDTNVTIGLPITEVKTAMQTIEARKRIQVDISTRKLGNIRMISIPLFDEETGEVVGTFGITTPRNLASNLQNAAAKLSSNTEEMASVMQQIASSAGEINVTESKLADEINAVQEHLANIANVLVFTKDVANQTKMLGLNAAIEAARAGDLGKGFGVVAGEIRKLSDQSKQTADDIGQLIRAIEIKMREAVAASQGTVKQSQEQAAATEEITATVMEMAEVAEKLTTLAKSL
ncbi:MAG: methyl-accepting chemotaxis protein [Syntrophomonadaceae bacterium]|nr:methyl-accepting chemotaxis protein [Syntrophomonadaceae bacterium]